MFRGCIDGIDPILAGALTEGYMALTEGAKVCRDLKPLYNTIMATGDWELLEPGSHQTKVRLKVSPELIAYAKEHYSQTQNKPLMNSILFTGTELSDKGHGVQNIAGNIKQAYELAAKCEYEMNGKDISKVTWVKRAQPFMDRFGHGKPVWEPDEEETVLPKVANADEPYTVTTDGQTYECPWMKYRKPKGESGEVSGKALTEGVFGDFGRKLAKGMAIAAIAGGFMAAEASPKASPVAKAEQTVKKAGNAVTKITKAELKDLYASKAYSDRVAEILKDMVSRNPSGDEQAMYTKACLQALTEVATGKLKP